jgi:hypothetical protein
MTGDSHGGTGSRGGASSKNSIAFKEMLAASNNSLPAAPPKQHQQQQSQRNISIDTIVASQFENEAETHILAALEIEERDQSNLLGEGIDTNPGGMDDYSEDETDDDNNLHRSSSGVAAGSHRERTYSSDSFLRRVHMQNDQPQYHMQSYEVDNYSSSSPTSSPTPSSSQRQQQQKQHARYSSTNSGYLPSVPDDSALLYDYLERNDLDRDNDTAFVDVTAGGGIDENEDATNREGYGEGGGAASSGLNATSTATGAAVKLQTQSSHATDNVTTMASRLAQLQRSGSRRFSRRFSLRSPSSSSSGQSPPSGGRVDYNTSSHDKLIDALNGVDSASRGFLGKMRYEWNLLIVPKLPKFRQQISHVLLFLVIPCLAVATILFYMFDNPMAGDTGTSISWWIIFIGARQAITIGLAWIGQVFWVEILALRSRLFNTIVGPYVSLAIIQSSG